MKKSKTLIGLAIILFALNGNSQNWNNKLIGIFQKNYVDTYTKVSFKLDSTFDFYKSWDIMNYRLSGRYKIINDTLILNSSDSALIGNNHIFLKDEKWIIINENKIYTGTDYNPKIIYTGGFLERIKD